MAQKLFREPLLHFVALGALLFAMQRWLGSDDRYVPWKSGLPAELARQYRDQQGRDPTPEEAKDALRRWQRDEALYREALRRGLERDDPAVRAALIDKMTALAALAVHVPEPTDAELEAYLRANVARYEEPLRYDFELLTFSGDPSGAATRARVEQALGQGATPGSLGHPVSSAFWNDAELKERLPASLSSRLPALAVGGWHALGDGAALYLVRVRRRVGGLSGFAELRPNLVIDWTAAERERRVAAELDKTVRRYTFESLP